MYTEKKEARLKGFWEVSRRLLGRNVNFITHDIAQTT